MSAVDQVRLLPLTEHRDVRGSFCELIRPPHRLVQASLVVCAPGVRRGGHYHRRKREWFCAVQGRAEFALRGVDDHSQRSLELSGPWLLEIPPGVWHGLTNPDSAELLLVIFVDEAFDPADPDTYREGGDG